MTKAPRKNQKAGPKTTAPAPTEGKATRASARGKSASKKNATSASGSKSRSTAKPSKDRGKPTPVAAEIVDESNRFIPPEELGRESDELNVGDIDEIEAELSADLPMLNEESEEIRPVAAELVDDEVASELIAKSGSKALTPTDPVATYLAEIRRYPLLTKEQERELAIRYRETGDPKAAEALVTANLRFVVKVAAEYSKFGAKLIDLIQEGNVGLMHAVKEFNPYKGVRLITYAVWWIRGYIQEYMMRQFSMVRIGTTQNQRKLFYRLQKEREMLEQMGQEPSHALLAGRLGVSEEEVEMMSNRLTSRDVSLNNPIDDSSSTSLLDFEASAEPAVDDELGRLEQIEVLNRNLEKIRPNLSEKELYLLEHRVLADEPVTLQEIGEHFGVTREAVRQLEARLIGKIRAAVTESLGEGSSEG